MTKCLFISLFAITLLACSKNHPITEVAPFKNTVPLHDQFHITLPENHTTGYMWQMNSNYDSKVVDYIKSVWHGNEKGVDFNFEAGQKGTTALNFTLIKYTDTLEARQFVIEVK